MIANRVFAALAMLMAYGALHPEAAAAYTWSVRVDNYSNPGGSMGHWASYGSVTVCVGDTADYVCGGVPNEHVIGNHDINFSSSPVSDTSITFLDLIMDPDSVDPDSEDMFVADQIEVFHSANGTGDLVESIGVDNELGYCISREAGDYDSTCHRSEPSTNYWIDTLYI